MTYRDRFREKYPGSHAESIHVYSCPFLEGLVPMDWPCPIPVPHPDDPAIDEEQCRRCWDTEELA